MIDTQDFARRMREAGIEPKSAERLAELFRDTSVGMGSAYVTNEALRMELRLAEGRIVLKLGVGLGVCLAIQTAIIALVLR